MKERIVRPSSLTSYLDCPRRWAARHLRDEVVTAGYELNTSPPTSAGALVGSGVHAGAAWTLEQMRAAGSAGPEADAVEQAILGFRDRLTIEGADWDETTDRPNTAEAQITRMVKVYRRQVAPGIEPIEIEQRAEASFAPGWIVSGQLDTLARNAAAAAGPDAGQTIRDLKTGRKRANGVQYGTYSMIFEAHGYLPTTIIEDFIPRVRLSKEQPDAEPVALDLATARQDAWETLHAVRRDTDEFVRRVADPNAEAPTGAFRPNPGSSLCSARWCPAHGTRFCRSHRPA